MTEFIFFIVGLLLGGCVALHLKSKKIAFEIRKNQSV